MMQRLKVDEIVHADDRDKAREFECPICMSIPSSSSAVHTICCASIFCTECLAPLAKCPNCRAGLEPDKKSAPLPKLVQRMMLGLKVVCPNQLPTMSRPIGSIGRRRPLAVGGSSTGGGGSSSDKRRGGDVGCDWSGSYGDLLNKHIGECSYVEIDCPHGCGARFLRRELSKHEDGCEKGYEECAICRSLVKIGGMAEHRREAAEMHVKILEAERSDLQAQVAGLDAVQAKVDGVKADVGAITVELTTMKEDLGKLIGAGGTRPRGVWKVTTRELFDECKAKGDLLKSPEICLGSGDKFTFSFYAMGHSTSNDNRAGLYLQQTVKETCWPGEVIVDVCASGGEFTRAAWRDSWKHVFDSSSLGFGYSGAIAISDLRKAAEVVVSFYHADGDNGHFIQVNGTEQVMRASWRRCRPSWPSWEDMQAELAAMQAKNTTELRDLRQLSASNYSLFLDLKYLVLGMFAFVALGFAVMIGKK